MEMLTKVACLMVLCMVVIAPHAEAAITCNQVTNNLTPCLPFLMNGGSVAPACCNGVRGLNSAAKTTLDRQNTCRCLISASKSIRGINLANAGNLPGLCRVNIAYKISPSTDCSKVK